MTRQVIVTAQYTGSTTDAAKALRALANAIETGTATRIVNGGMHAMVRNWADNGVGEDAIGGRYHAVDHEGMNPECPVALFRSKYDAEKWAYHGMVVTRADIVGSVWNSVDDDPHAFPADGGA